MVRGFEAQPTSSTSSFSASRVPEVLGGGRDENRIGQQRGGSTSGPGLRRLLAAIGAGGQRFVYPFSAKV